MRGGMGGGRISPAPNESPVRLYKVGIGFGDGAMGRLIMALSCKVMVIVTESCFLVIRQELVNLTLQ
jgi:hypothetical protein